MSNHNVSARIIRLSHLLLPVGHGSDAPSAPLVPVEGVEAEAAPAAAAVGGSGQAQLLEELSPFSDEARGSVVGLLLVLLAHASAKLLPRRRLGSR